jgi:CRP-like cAMP-binding protein
MGFPDTLLRSRVFDGLTDSERVRWLDRAATTRIDRGQTLARQGEPALHFHLLESGFLKLLQLTPEGTELIVRFIAPGDPFGGVVALRDAPYPVTAVAVQPSLALQWARDAVGALLGETPQVRVNIMREMTMHMTAALTRVRELTTASVDQRLAHTILRLAEQCGKPEKDGVLIAQPLTRQEIADLTGTTLYTASRTLAKWETLGIVETRQRMLFVRSTRQLEDIAGDHGE